MSPKLSQNNEKQYQNVQKQYQNGEEQYQKHGKTVKGGRALCASPPLIVFDCFGIVFTLFGIVLGHFGIVLGLFWGHPRGLFGPGDLCVLSFRLRVAGTSQPSP